MSASPLASRLEQSIVVTKQPVSITAMVENEKKDGQVNGQTSNHVDVQTQENNGQNRESMNPTVAASSAAKERLSSKKEKIRDKTNPPGGKDNTPIPPANDGYTVQFTFHRAENLPISDIKARSSDPYILATLTSPGIQTRHKEDPDMRHRTRTAHRSTNPVWNDKWIVAGIRSSGFTLKCRLYDEDPRDHDDRLGNVTITTNSIGESWSGIREQAYGIKKRMGSKRAYALKGCLSMLSRNIHIDGELFLSVKVLGKSAPPHGRMYTLGPTSWTKHFAPMIGRIAGTKNPEVEKSENGKVEGYDFQANQFQLQGPVPASLYHRFVEFKPFVKGMFSHTGLRGRILNKALHHQHNQIYNYGPNTEYGEVEPKSVEASKQLLELLHYDEGGRIFTYVLTLDGLWRFTETGKEFGIDLLSKHTMHSDVNVYIAISGEFFIRRLAKPDESATAPNQETHPANDIPGGPPDEPPPKDPKDYELVIDNDSGTYRPKGELLGDLKRFLSDNFPGIHVLTKECTDKELSKWKEEQREFKKKQGKNVQVVQNSDDDISTSDEESLNRHVGGKQRSKRQKAYQALEDPRGALKDAIPGESGRKEREEKESTEDMAAEGSRST